MLLLFVFLLIVEAVIAVENINSEYSVDANTVALFHFNQNSGTKVIDETGRYNGTMGAGASWATSGKFSNALQTSGTAQRVDLNDNTFGNAMPEGTVEAWFKADSFNSVNCSDIWGKAESTSPAGLYRRWGIFICTNITNKISYQMRTGPPDTVASIHDLEFNYTFSTGKWYHVAGTWGPAGMKIYLNGERVASSSSYTGSSPTITGRPFTIGQSYSYNGREFHFNGIIDELRVGNVARNYTISCTEGVQNGNETDIDCGGNSCQPCAEGKSCSVDSDCINNYCNSNKICSMNYAPKIVKVENDPVSPTENDDVFVTWITDELADSAVHYRVNS